MSSQIELIIDNRERELKTFFSNYSNVKFSNLDIGDIVFRYQGDIVVLIERKTIGDLISSIKDGRYREQKLRILNHIPRDKVLYLLEGGKISQNNYAGKLVWGSMVSMLIRDRIKIVRTIDVGESIQFIDRIYQRLMKDPSKLLPSKISGDGNGNDGGNDIKYASSIKIRKKENLTPYRCGILQLAQIPGLSTKIAQVILDKYGSVYNLCCCYQQILGIDGNGENGENGENKTKAINLLSEIKYNIANGKSRRVGKVASTKVYTYLCQRCI